MSQPVLAPAGTRGGSWGRTARLVWRLFAPAPLPVVAAVGLMTLNGCTAGLYAVTVAGLVNGLTGHGPALALTAAFTAVVLLELGTNTYREVTDTWLGNTATLRAQGLVLERAGAVALERFEVLNGVHSNAAGLKLWLDRGGNTRNAHEIAPHHHH